MDIGHDRVISVLFNAENSHASSPFRADRLTSQRGQLGRGVRAFLEHTSLRLPEWPMKLAGTALRTDAIASAVVVVIWCFLHQHLECQGASFWVHILLTSISEQKNKPRHCSAMRSAITGLCYILLIAASSFQNAVAAHRSHTACFHFAREVGQNQRNTSVFKAF